MAFLRRQQSDLVTEVFFSGLSQVCNTFAWTGQAYAVLGTIVFDVASVVWPPTAPWRLSFFFISISSADIIGRRWVALARILKWLMPRLFTHQLSIFNIGFFLWFLLLPSWRSLASGSIFTICDDYPEQISGLSGVLDTCFSLSVFGSRRFVFCAYGMVFNCYGVIVTLFRLSRFFFRAFRAVDFTFKLVCVRIFFSLRFEDSLFILRLTLVHAWLVRT